MVAITLHSALSAAVEYIPLKIESTFSNYVNMTSTHAVSLSARGGRRPRIFEAANPLRFFEAADPPRIFDTANLARRGRNLRPLRVNLPGNYSDFRSPGQGEVQTITGMGKIMWANTSSD